MFASDRICMMVWLETGTFSTRVGGQGEGNITV